MRHKYLFTQDSATQQLTPSWRSRTISIYMQLFNISGTRGTSTPGLLVKTIEQFYQDVTILQMKAEDATTQCNA